ncbi:polygalacturonase [Flavobacterium sp. 270]|uniref:glycoside hydrolase family 28 protein n=1 Tax=Flavobacterium sp. 270 TaxID=2512114 RepID=UPI00106622E5|nr:glycosyl hydrolase family 28 protein [Flavobacterium sp. 270]TDW48131.1 polygalacturonase [Flavobacterium sp. 270]
MTNQTSIKLMLLNVSFLILFLASNSIVAKGKDYDVSYFGIQSGGTILNTRSIQYGIDYISQNGGGRLVFSKGIYLTGCIHFKSDVTIQLDEGAVLLGSVNPFDYDRQNTAFDHNFSTSLALFLGLNQHNIGITGKGIIDGQGKELAANVGELLNKGLEKGGSIDRPDEDRRPMIINFFGCENVLIENITLKNSACWVQCYNQCKGVTVDNVRVESRAFWNNDGIDIVDCNNFKVLNSYFNSSDDGICLKSLNPDVANQNILIRNNSMTTDASGIKFGTASLGGFKDIKILNNKVFDTRRSAIALEAVDGAAIENIQIDGVQGTNIGNAIFLRAGARKGTRKGSINNVSIQNVTAEIRAENNPLKIMPGIVIAGLPEQIISDITLKNVTIKLPGGAEKALSKIAIENTKDIPEKPSSYPEYDMFGELPSWGVFIRHAKNLQITSLFITVTKPDTRTAVVLDDVHHVSFMKLKVKKQDNKKNIFTVNCSKIQQ